MTFELPNPVWRCDTATGKGQNCAERGAPQGRQSLGATFGGQRGLRGLAGLAGGRRTSGGAMRGLWRAGGGIWEALGVRVASHLAQPPSATYQAVQSDENMTNRRDPFHH